MNASATVWVPILVAIVTGLVTVGTVYFTGRANLHLERQKFEENSQLERQKFESSLILQAIATGDQDTALRNLKFLVAVGFLEDPKGRIAELTNEPADAPVLPAPGAQEWFSPPTRPGVFRWSVRTGADPDASLVERKPVVTTVEELAAIPRPEDMPSRAQSMPAYQNRRAEGAERTVYQVDAKLVEYKLEMSGNVHLTLAGTTGQTMIANCPDPNPPFVDPSSQWVKEIAEARREIVDTLNPVRSFTRTNRRVRLAGVGFFNLMHGQKGIAPNGLELTPILKIEWLPD